MKLAGKSQGRERAVRLIKLLLLLLTISLTTAVQGLGDEIYDKDVVDCKYMFPSFFTDYYARDACISEAKKTAAERRKAEELDSQRWTEIAKQVAAEEVARPCLASEIPKAEEKLVNLSVSIGTSTDYVTARELLTKIDPNAQEIIPDDGIKEKVFVAKLATSCVSNFYFLINIRFNEQHKVRWLRVWAENPPLGYERQSSISGSWIARFSNEIEEYQIKASAAAEENARVTRQIQANLRDKNEALKSLSFVSFQAKKLDYWDEPEFEFVIKNGSSRVIKRLMFGWDFYQAKCDSKPSIKMKYPAFDWETFVLAPGESRLFTFGSKEKIPANFAFPRPFCFSLLDIETAPY